MKGFCWSFCDQLASTCCLMHVWGLLFWRSSATLYCSRDGSKFFILKIQKWTFSFCRNWEKHLSAKRREWSAWMMLSRILNVKNSCCKETYAEPFNLITNLQVCFWVGHHNGIFHTCEEADIISVQKRLVSWTIALRTTVRVIGQNPQRKVPWQLLHLEKVVVDCGTTWNDSEIEAFYENYLLHQAELCLNDSGSFQKEPEWFLQWNEKGASNEKSVSTWGEIHAFQTNETDGWCYVSTRSFSATSSATRDF